MSILFLIIVVPILLGIVGLGGYGTKCSIYNESWDGLSNLRLALEGEGYTNITNGMSSLSLLNRVYEPGVLAIMGPATQYSTTDTISLITFLARGGSVIVADDYGTGAEIFEPLFNIMNTWDDIAAISDQAAGIIGVVSHQWNQLIFGYYYIAVHRFQTGLGCRYQEHGCIGVAKKSC